MKYYIEKFDLLLNLEGWHKIIKNEEKMFGDKIQYTITIQYENAQTNGLVLEEMYYWKDIEERDKIFEEINNILS